MTFRPFLFLLKIAASTLQRCSPFTSTFRQNIRQVDLHFYFYHYFYLHFLSPFLFLFVFLFLLFSFLGKWGIVRLFPSHSLFELFSLCLVLSFSVYLSLYLFSLCICLSVFLCAFVSLSLLLYLSAFLSLNYFISLCLFLSLNPLSWFYIKYYYFFSSSLVPSTVQTVQPTDCQIRSTQKFRKNSSTRNRGSVHSRKRRRNWIQVCFSTSLWKEYFWINS